MIISVIHNCVIHISLIFCVVIFETTAVAGRGSRGSGRGGEWMGFELDSLEGMVCVELAS